MTRTRAFTSSSAWDSIGSSTDSIGEFFVQAASRCRLARVITHISLSLSLSLSFLAVQKNAVSFLLHPTPESRLWSVKDGLIPANIYDQSLTSSEILQISASANAAHGNSVAMSLFDHCTTIDRMVQQLEKCPLVEKIDFNTISETQFTQRLQVWSKSQARPGDSTPEKWPETSRNYLLLYILVRCWGGPRPSDPNQPDGLGLNKALTWLKKSSLVILPVSLGLNAKTEEPYRINQFGAIFMYLTQMRNATNPEQFARQHGWYPGWFGDVLANAWPVVQRRAPTGVGKVTFGPYKDTPNPLIFTKLSGGAFVKLQLAVGAQTRALDGQPTFGRRCTAV
jgi:hypothetical protein